MTNTTYAGTNTAGTTSTSSTTSTSTGAMSTTSTATGATGAEGTGTTTTAPRTVAAYAAPAPKAPLEKTTVPRRALGEHDILIDVRFAGICHSDIHQVCEDWGDGIFPMVPGHEIAGVVAEVGPGVTRWSVGDRVGVGCFVDSCRECDNCRAGLQQFCTGTGGAVFTYNGVGRDGEPTYGGYSSQLVVDEGYALRIPDSLPLDAAAPLLCAGITVYSPLSHWGAGPGKKVAIVGLGGLGHLGVKIAHAKGAEVTVLSQSLRKREDGLRLGADDYRATSDPAVFTELAGTFDLIVNTVSADLDLSAYLGLLRTGGTLVQVGAPEKPVEVLALALLTGRKSLSGSMIGGLPETQEMLDFCAEHQVTAEIELIRADQINEAYARVLASDVRYRFVIDASTI
ncbi:NAD(P)-dependent alcohol dehydrogenase [Kitasatospora sp. NPDC050463]|uniref:NAD(P)-dependent alcohol dehydrogenase n=1 Tax=Kitasatospora sp. NPDC050463 TaxID=3155786 RepID=UPI0033FCC9F9